MTAAAKPSTNGTHQPNGTHTANGHTPHNRLTGLPEPLNTVPTVDGPAAKPKPAAEQKQSEGRTEKGTFAPGNKFACGNPNNRKMAVLRSALLEGMTAERMKALGERLYAAAMAGNWIAAKLLLTYAIGRPVDVVDPDRLDLEEFRLLAESPDREQWAAGALADQILPGGAVVMLKALMEANLQKIQGILDKRAAS